MKLFSLINNDYTVIGEDKEITGLSCKNFEAKDGDLYFCIKGFNVDGHKFAGEAVKKGAKAVVCERKLNLPDDITQVIVPSTRKAMSQIANKYYGEPQKNMKLVLVTGTNGKTTTTYMLNRIFGDAGYKVGVIGTNGTFIDNKYLESKLTTPDPIDLYKIFKDMKDSGCNIVCMEASAHALALDKLTGLIADVAVLTNITQDHLDFFGDMETYAQAKQKLFTPEMCKMAVMNIDNKFGDYFYQSCSVPTLTYAINTPADINAEYITQNKVGQHFSANLGGKIYPVDLQVDGKFNVENSLAAILVAKMFGIKTNEIVKSLSSFPPVPGRFNRIDKNGVNVIIDFAHTPDGVKNVLTCAKEMAGNNRLYTVFGCGGDRDAAKRSLMGNTVCNLSNYAIITNDNPRFEKPESIVRDIESGIDGRNYMVNLNRASAISQALSMASSGDVVAILGKGNEEYMEIAGNKQPFNDKEIVEKY